MGMMVFAAGIGMIALAVILLIVGVVYSRTAGKKIREELKGEYE